MADQTWPANFHPWNGVVAPGSPAEIALLRRWGIEDRAIAKGVRPSPAHDLIYHGGKTIQNLTFTNLYVGGASAWSQNDIQNIDSALAAAMSDVDLNNVMMQYFNNQPITTTFRPSQVLPDPVTGTFSKGDVEALVSRLYTNGQMNGYDLSVTAFNFLLPSGIVLTDDASITSGALATVAMVEDAVSSLEGLGGYHGSVHAAGANGSQVTIYYCIGVYSEMEADGTSNGIPVFDAPWKNVVATFYHELNEVRTDADVEDAIRAGNDPSATQLLGWMSQQGEECGDYPVFEANPLTQVFQEVPLTDGSRTVPVQFQYSNAVHGPEGPIPSPHTSA